MESKKDQRIADLEKMVSQQSEEIEAYKNELMRTNLSLKKLIEQIQHEVKSAGEVQRLLSPTVMPRIPGIEFSTKFVPGSHIGGDYFDIFEHEDRLRFGILLASASGYAMSALFLSVLIKMTSKSEARKGMEPDQVLRRIIQEMIPKMSEKDRASVFYGVIDRRTLDLKFSLVGSVKAYIQEYTNHSLHSLDPFGDEFTKDYRVEPQCMKVTLNPKDRIIVCSEGLIQTKNPLGEYWGGKNLSRSIRQAPRQGVHELRNNILFENEQFSSSQNPVRDLTVVVAEVKENVIKLAKS